MTSADLLADLRAFAFARAAGAPPRIGAEIELIPADAETGRMAPVHPTDRPGTLPLLRAVGAELGWVEEADADAPKFHTPAGSLVGYEPGGQIEVSTPPYPTVGALLAALHEVVLPLREAAPAAGIRLREVGIDPATALRDVPLQLRSDRYRSMDEYLSSHGPAGPRMMRQTASLQVNLDWADDLALHWRVLNAAAPFLNATFANSPCYAGSDTGSRSFRGLVWADLDPLRTGMPAGAGPGVDQAAAAYLHFALAAPTLLKHDADGAPLPFGAWVERGEATPAEWRLHLTTLFPEVRPKGYAEVRSIDALPAEWYAAPLVLLAGLSHPATLAAAAELLGPPRPELLRPAARHGLAHPEIGPVAAALFELALAGAGRLPWVDRASLDAAHAYFERFTRVGRSLADDTRYAARHTLLPTPAAPD
jgi:glutamate--cysteine ligase